MTLQSDDRYLLLAPALLLDALNRALSAFGPRAADVGVLLQTLVAAMPDVRSGWSVVLVQVGNS